MKKYLFVLAFLGLSSAAVLAKENVLEITSRAIADAISTKYPLGLVSPEKFSDFLANKLSDVEQVYRLHTWSTSGGGPTSPDNPMYKDLVFNIVTPDGEHHHEIKCRMRIIGSSFDDISTLELLNCGNDDVRFDEEVISVPFAEIESEYNYGPIKLGG